MITEEKPPIQVFVQTLEGLKHYGVSGMQRGVRKLDEPQMDTHARVQMAKRLADELQRRASQTNSQSQADALNKSAQGTDNMAGLAEQAQLGAGWGNAARLAALLTRRQNMDPKSETIGEKHALSEHDQQIMDSGEFDKLKGHDLAGYDSRMRSRLKGNTMDPLALKYFSKMYPDVTIAELISGRGTSKKFDQGMKEPVAKKPATAKKTAAAKTVAAKTAVAKTVAKSVIKAKPKIGPNPQDEARRKLMRDKLNAVDRRNIGIPGMSGAKTKK